MDKQEFDLVKLSKQHLALHEELYQARIDKKNELINNLETEISHLESKIWKVRTANFPALREFSSLFEALKLASSKLSIPFPEISYSRENQFLFSVSDSQRGVLIVLREDAGSYVVSLNEKQADQTLSYRGEAKSLEQVASVLSRWYGLRDSIFRVCQDFPWISNNAVEIPS